MGVVKLEFIKILLEWYVNIVKKIYGVFVMILKIDILVFLIL